MQENAHRKSSDALSYYSIKTNERSIAAMKSIQQNCQLSEEELKSVFRKDGEEFSRLLLQNIDFSKIRNDLSGLADGILKKTKQAFQILLEKIIAEEFFDFLEDIEKEGGDSSRNGYYTRKIRTYLGDFDIQIPRARYERFQTALLGKYKHSIGDIEEKVLQLYLGGMSEAEVVDAIANTNGIGISREKVGQIVRSTLGEATEFNSRPIKDCPVVFMDATYVPFKRGILGTKSVEKEGILVALGINPDGNKEILGYLFGETESIDRWKILLRNLKDRGLKNPRLFVTDGLSGMPEACQELFPGSKHQRCIVHYIRNLQGYVNRKETGTIKSDFYEVLKAGDREKATERFETFKKYWSSKYHGMERMLDQTGENIFTFMDFPKEIWKPIYTSNAIESFNSKAKRELRKRIQMNSEGNAYILVTHICKSYNASKRNRCMTGLRSLPTDVRESLGFVGV